MEDGQGTNQPNLDDTAVSKSVQEIVKDYPPKVPMSKNIQLIGEYSSMIQKEQFLEHTEEIVNPISEPSELENTKPINSNKISPAYVLKMTKLRPASSYAKPSNNEARNIVTVPYKPTVKLPCKVLKPVKKLNMITNAKVYEKPFDPKDEAIALKHIKEKIYQKSYLKTNENEQIVLKPTEVFAEPSDAETVEPPPKKKSKARRNTIAVRPPKVVVPKVPKEKSPKNAVVPKVPKKKVNQRSELIDIEFYLNIFVIIFTFFNREKCCCTSGCE